MKKFKLVTLLGIRPDFIRMQKLIKLLDKCDLIDHFFIHSGQHFDYELDRLFFEELGIRKPDLNFEIGKTLKEKGLKTNHAYQTALLAQKLADFLEKYRPDAIMYLGDTNTVTSSIIAAKYNVPVIHIEGGGRSFDWRMPEEKNRIIIDHLSDVIYCYLDRYRKILLAEGISKARIKVVGNIIVDAINDYSEKVEKSNILKDLKIEEKKFILVTLHREENITNKWILEEKLKNLLRFSQEKKVPLVFPIMPRLKIYLKNFKLDRIIKSNFFITTPPLGFFDFVKLEKSARCIVSDSGTVQEEALILGTPCVVARRSTERPETLWAGASILEGIEKKDSLYKKIKKAWSLKTNWNRNVLNPQGGSPSERVFKDLTQRIKNNYFEKSRSLPFLKKNKFVKEAYNLK